MLSLFSPALPSAGEGGYVVARLDQPWPASVGRASPAAGRAIRMLREANASHVELTLAAAEWQRLQEAAGARATLLARDATAHYARRAAAAGRGLAEQRRPGVGEAPGRRLASGSMGGFLTLSEAYAELERLRSEHPTLLTELPTQGKSRQGRPLRVWCATAGLGECTRASARPAVLYTSLVHAREPQTLMCLLRFLQVTLDSAARDADSQAARLVQSRKLLLVPVANPDGYEWNRAHSPRGGGMRRKNGLKTCGRESGDGVDLNRNFGHKWAHDSIGSSGSGCSEEYRGTAAFSEPETQAIRALVKEHRPAATLHWHGWGEDLAFPFSYDWRAKLSVADLSAYQEFALEMTARNGYASGRAWEVVGYTTNGEADDWGWGDEGVYSFTLEVGNSRDGFWPAPSRIAPIAEQSVYAATYLLAAAGAQLQVHGVSLSGASSGGSSGSLVLSLQNNGLAHILTHRSVCVRADEASTSLAASPASEAGGAARWSHQDGRGLCTPLPPLKARASHSLPPLAASWSRAERFFSLSLLVGEPRRRSLEASELEGRREAAQEGGLAPASRSRSLGQLGHPAALPAAAELAVTAMKVRVSTDDRTATTCNEECLCSVGEAAVYTLAAECRDKTRRGATCRAPLRASTGTNYASGKADEFFVWQPGAYREGGVCRVSSTTRDTLIAVYATCSRVGAQEPLGFSNSEGHTATVDFPCVAGREYHLFWNAEYMPGRHAFTLSERCDGGRCLRATGRRSLSIVAPRWVRFRDRKKKQRA